MSSPLDRLGPRVIVTKFNPAAKSVHSPEVRALCHRGSEFRIPVLPRDCPKCHSETGKLILQMCYKEGVSGKWTIICSPGEGQKCGFRQIPPQPAPPGDILESIAAVRVCEAADKAAAQQVAQDQQQASGAADVGLAAAANARRAEKALFDAVRVSQQSSKERQRQRQHDEELLAALNDMRAKFASETTIVGKVAKPKKTIPARARPGMLILWHKTLEGPTRIPIEIPANNKVDLGDHLAAHGVGLWSWQRWDCGAAIWMLGCKDVVEVPDDETAILIRENRVSRCIHFGEELHLLENIRGSTKAARAAELNAATERFETIKARTESDNPHIWVVCYWKDGLGPLVWQLPRGARVGDSQTICLGDHAEVVTRWESTTREPAIHVWSVPRTDWVEYDLFEAIPIALSATTLLIRLPEVDDLAYLGVEIFALANPRATVLASKARKRAASSSPKVDTSAGKKTKRAAPSSRCDDAPPAKKTKRAGGTLNVVDQPMRALSHMTAQAGPSTQGDLSVRLSAIAQGVFGLSGVL